MKDYSLILKENIEKYSFSDLFDVKELQLLQDQFSEVLHVAMVIFDKDGIEITNRSNFTSFCKNIKAQKRTPEQCFKAIVGRKKPYVAGYKIYRCEAAGIMYGIVNIRIGDIYIGDWYVGQVREESVEPDWDQLSADGYRTTELKKE